MASKIPLRKRKTALQAEESDGEFNGAELDGILSGSEDDIVESTDDSEQPESDFDEDEDDLEGESDANSVLEEGDGDGANGKLGDEEENRDEPHYTVVKDANGNQRYEYAEVDPVYDSDDSDAQGPTNTIGNIPLSFYDSYPHIGYDINGKRIMRPAKGEALDALLDSIELPKGWTGLTDPETGKPLNLSRDELELLKRVQMNEVPQDGYDQYAVGAFLFCYDARC